MTKAETALTAPKLHLLSLWSSFLCHFGLGEDAWCIDQLYWFCLFVVEVSACTPACLTKPQPLSVKGCRILKVSAISALFACSSLLHSDFPASEFSFDIWHFSPSSDIGLEMLFGSHRDGWCCWIGFFGWIYPLLWKFLTLHHLELDIFTKRTEATSVSVVHFCSVRISSFGLRKQSWSGSQ